MRYKRFFYSFAVIICLNTFKVDLKYLFNVVVLFKTVFLPEIKLYIENGQKNLYFKKPVKYSENLWQPSLLYSSGGVSLESYKLLSTVTIQLYKWWMLINSVIK